MIRPLKKRGVAPVIATVLLIGIVIVIGLIIFLWLQSFTQEAVVKFDKNVELVCGDVKFDTEYTGGMLTVSNIGNVAIYEVKVKMLQDKSTNTQNINDLANDWPSSGLNPGRVFSEDISDDIDIDTESIVIIPVLVGSGEDGQKSYVCDEAQFGREIIIL